MRYNAESFNPNKTLKRVRESSGMTQKDFAEAIGITERDLKNIENRDTNKNGIGILNYLKWCDKLDCDINYLLGFEVEPTDICSVTGLNPEVVDILKKEKKNPTTSEIRNGKNAVIIGMTTADLINALSGYKGMDLKDLMLQYTRENTLYSLLEESVRNIVAHHNTIKGRRDSFESVIKYFDSTLSSIRLMSSLSSLTFANRMQKGIDDDFTVFCDKLKAEGYEMIDCKVLFDYMQSRSRVEALKMKCYDILLNFLDKLSEDGQLKYHSTKLDGDFEITASILYEESIDDIERSQNEMIESSARREITRLKSRLYEQKKIQQNLIDGNNRLSDELNSERKKVRELKKELKKYKSDTE